MIKHTRRTLDEMRSAICEGCMRLLDFNPVDLLQGLVGGFLDNVCVIKSCLASGL